VKGEQKARSPLELQRGERFGMQGVIEQSLTEGDASRRVISRQGDRSAHSSDGGNGVVHACHVEHRRDLADALALAADEMCRRSVEGQLGRRKSARAELVLEAVDANVAERAVIITEPDEEDAQVFLILDVGKRDRDLRRRRRGEPLGAEQAIGISRRGGIRADSRNRRRA
jgi:hypothetical protein